MNLYHLSALNPSNLIKVGQLLRDLFLPISQALTACLTCMTPPVNHTTEPSVLISKVDPSDSDSVSTPRSDGDSLGKNCKSPAGSPDHSNISSLSHSETIVARSRSRSGTPPGDVGQLELIPPALTFRETLTILASLSPSSEGTPSSWSYSPSGSSNSLGSLTPPSEGAPSPFKRCSAQPGKFRFLRGPENGGVPIDTTRPVSTITDLQRKRDDYLNSHLSSIAIDSRENGSHVFNYSGNKEEATALRGHIVHSVNGSFWVV